MFRGDAHLVDATGTRRRLQALVAVGWTATELAGRLGMARRGLFTRTSVPVELAAEVARLYEALSGQRPADDERTDAARRMAAWNRWPPPSAWDNDTIDDPEAEPYDGDRDVIHAIRWGSALTAIEVRHGYTLADLDRLTRAAVTMAWPRAMGYSDRYDTAWSVIAERICTAVPPPADGELKLAGSRAVNRLAQDHGRHHGQDRRADGAYEVARGFLKFWELDRRAVSSPELPVVERLALRQIWPELSDTHQRVLLAMAIHSDNVLAAQAVGKSYVTFNTHLKNARRRVLELWHEGETPSRIWGKGDRRKSLRRTATQLLHNRIRQRERRAAKEEQ